MNHTNVQAGIASATVVGSGWTWFATHYQAIAAICAICGGLASLAIFIKTILEIRNIKKQRKRA